MNILMVGVDKKRIGGMWTVAETYLNNPDFNKSVKLTYIPTNSYGSVVLRIATTVAGYAKIIYRLAFGHIDLVHIHMAEKGSTFRKGIVVHMAKLFGKKVVVQLHAGPFIAWYDTQGKGRQRLIRGFFQKADRVLALGEYWKQQLTELVPEEKLSVLYNGSYSPAKNPYNENGKKILYLGVMKKAKGTFDLISAMSLIHGQLDPDVKLYLCGKEEEDGIPELIKELGLEERISLTGWISKEQRLELFQDTMLCVHPSYFEALSMTVIEAICYGIPVVTTDISTMSEIMGEDAVLSEPGDVKTLAEHVLRMAEDIKGRKEASDRLHARARKLFSTEQNIQETIRIYRECLGEEKQ